MLTERERRALQEIERGLSNDPGLVRALAGGAAALAARDRRHRLVYDVLAGLSAAAALVCVALPSSATFRAALVAAVLTTVVVIARRRRFPAHRSRHRRRSWWQDLW